MSMLCRRAVAAGAFLALGAFAFPAAAQDQRIVFSTNWKAQAEHGGYYQAVAKGFYKKRGLDVQIRQGGPAIDNQQLMAAGAIDMAIGSNDFYAFNLVQADAPAVAVAAIFQKDPQILLLHATSPIASLADMKGKPVMIAKSASNTYWLWLKAKYGFTDEQIRPYTFNSAPFLVDKNAIQQGYISSEPYKIKKEAGVDTKFFLLADHGYGTYGNLVIVQRKLVDEKPAVVQGFVEASIEGWYDYLYGDPSPGNALIKKDNPDMDDGLIAEGISKMRQYGIVDSGDTKELGVGAMTDARWKAFFDELVKVGGYPATLDYKRAYTTQFVNKNHAAEMRPKGAL
ncbi:MAG: ABC transporter substrate-binding protein [Microvirga sp.]